MKRIDQAAYDMIKAELDGSFPGGQILTFNAANDGIGIPGRNPNLTMQLEAKVAEIFGDLKSGKITVSAEQGALIK